MNKGIEIEVNRTSRPRKVTLHLVEREYYGGGVRRRRQYTVTERAFTTALQEANIIAPWNVVGR